MPQSLILLLSSFDFGNCYFFLLSLYTTTIITTVVLAAVESSTTTIDLPWTIGLRITRVGDLPRAVAQFPYHDALVVSMRVASSTPTESEARMLRSFARMKSQHRIRRSSFNREIVVELPYDLAITITRVMSVKGDGMEASAFCLLRYVLAPLGIIFEGDIPIGVRDNKKKPVFVTTHPLLTTTTGPSTAATTTSRILFPHMAAEWLIMRRVRVRNKWYMAYPKEQLRIVVPINAENPKLWTQMSRLVVEIRRRGYKHGVKQLVPNTEATPQPPPKQELSPTMPITNSKGAPSPPSPDYVVLWHEMQRLGKGRCEEWEAMFGDWIVVQEKPKKKSFYDYIWAMFKGTCAMIMERVIGGGGKWARAQCPKCPSDLPIKTYHQFFPPLPLNQAVGIFAKSKGKLPPGTSVAEVTLERVEKGRQAEKEAGSGSENSPLLVFIPMQEAECLDELRHGVAHAFRAVYLTKWRHLRAESLSRILIEVDKALIFQHNNIPAAPKANAKAAPSSIFEGEISKENEKDGEYSMNEPETIIRYTAKRIRQSGGSSDAELETSDEKRSKNDNKPKVIE